MSSASSVAIDGSADASGALPTLHVLGRLELVAPSGAVLLGPGKPLALLAYLRLQSVHSVTRPHLIDLLWSDLEPERARANVRQALLVLRRLLPEGSLVSAGDQVSLVDGLTTDRDVFVAAVDRGDYAAAIAEYRGDFIPDVAVPGGAEFELWCEIERRHLAALFARVLDATARSSLATGRSGEALQHARRLRDLDPSRERSWRLLIEAEVAAEGVASARLEADRLAEQLRAEQRPPEPATERLFQRVREVPRQQAAARGALSEPEFVGRETQLARVLAGWNSAKRGSVRRLHVEASAGTGKTRLLDESCARLQATGARVARCGARRDERDMPYALAATVVTTLAQFAGSIAVAPASMSSLVAMAPDASSVFAAPVDASTGDEARRRRTVALADLFGAVTHDCPVALAIDDTHWADRESVDVLSLALGRLEAGTPLFVLSAGREPLPSDAGAERMSLPPFDRAQVDAMLQSVAAAGEVGWWETFVAALRDAAEGVPFHVLQLLHAVVEKQLLGVEDDQWVARNVPALLAALSAGEAALLRIAQLSVSARRVLQVLSCGAALDSAAVAEATALDAVVVEADLATLEVRGFVRRSVEGRWRVAHDEINDQVVAQAEPGALAAARRAVAQVLARRTGVSMTEMRHIVGLMVQAEADGEVAEVVRGWVRNGDCPAAGVQGADLLPPGLVEERAAPLRRALRRTLPRRGRNHRGHLIAAALLLVVAIGAWYVTRPYALVVVERMTITASDIIPDRPAVIGVVDRLGFRRRPDGVPVTMTSTPDRTVAGRSLVSMHDGVATFDSVRLSVGDNATYRLTFAAPGLRPVLLVEDRVGFATLRIASGVLNGQVLRGPVPRVHAAPGDSITGHVIFTYTARWPAATVFFGGVASWYPRESDTTSLRPLMTPTVDARAEGQVSRRAPTEPGTYLLLWFFGAEPNAGFLSSATNWTCERPLWHNGDDLLDYPNDSLMAWATRGGYLGKFITCMSGNQPRPPHSSERDIGIGAVELVVAPR